MDIDAKGAKDAQAPNASLRTGLTQTKAANDRSKSLKNIASQSLADIATDTHQTSQSSQANCQPITQKPQIKDYTRNTNGDRAENGTPAKLSSVQTVSTVNISPAQPKAGGSQQRSFDKDGSIPTRAAKRCEVCNSDRDVCWDRGLRACINCRKTFKNASDGTRYRCLRDNNCEIVYQPRVKLCSSCKLKKALGLGLLAPVQESPARHSHDGISSTRNSPTLPPPLDSLEMIEEEALQAAIAASMQSFKEETEMWENASGLLASSFLTDRPASPKIQKVYLEEQEPPSIDEYGLPSTVTTFFSRWFYNGMSNLQPGDRKIKNKRDEIKPQVQRTGVVYSNHIQDDGLTLLTTRLNSENLASEEPMPVEEIVTPVISYTPSKALLMAEQRHEASSKRLELPLRAGDAVQMKAKPKLTITVKTVRTIIDRRPMLKRLRVTYTPTRSNHESSAGVTSTSLIAPEEDCDDDEDEEYQEIDCE